VTRFTASPPLDFTATSGLFEPAEAPRGDATATPRAPSVPSALGDVWRHRRYFWFFCRRAVNYRYKQALFGWFWLFLRSLLWILPFSFVVGQVAARAADGVPYTLFVLAGLTLWNYISNGITFGTLGLRYERDVATQLGLPPMLLVLSNVAVVLIELAVTIGVLYGIGVVYFFRNGQSFLPLTGGTPMALVWIALATLLAAGIGLITSVLDQYATDIRIIVPYLLSFWMLLTPIVYPVSAVSERHRWLVWLNPVTPVVEGFRHALLGLDPLSPMKFAWGAVAAISAFWLGAWFFSRATAAEL
jgi:lipopolysaccharide transport system permease protein